MVDPFRTWMAPLPCPSGGRVAQMHPERTYPLLKVAPASGRSTYTTSPRAFCAKSVIPTVATSPSSCKHQTSKCTYKHEALRCTLCSP